MHYVLILRYKISPELCQFSLSQSWEHWQQTFSPQGQGQTVNKKLNNQKYMMREWLPFLGQKVDSKSIHDNCARIEQEWMVEGLIKRLRVCLQFKCNPSGNSAETDSTCWQSTSRKITIYAWPRTKLSCLFTLILIQLLIIVSQLLSTLTLGHIWVIIGCIHELVHAVLCVIALQVQHCRAHVSCTSKPQQAWPRHKSTELPGQGQGDCIARSQHSMFWCTPVL